ncbi:MAG: DUF362 domain-containing protein [Propionibacteriaceae bacterium]|jgi:uncharacterized Fe-S center protein|nr:DUF362 domain-containing protein [Propionibacteriaceae bacterium]
MTSKKATVYYTKEISAASLLAAYRVLGRELGGKVAIKLHMGESGNTNYLDPELLREVVAATGGSFTDSNTAYGGSRSTTEGHLKTAAEHGYTYAPVDVLDADGHAMLPVSGGKHVQEAMIGAHLNNYDSLLSIAHFKGHGMAGFGGSFKNIAVGMASSEGKADIHGKGFSYNGEPFFERVVEYAKAVMEKVGDNVAYVNVLNKLSTSCDCDASAPPAELDDIGILASLDPVALDRASVDLVNAAAEAQDSTKLVERIEGLNAQYLLDYAEGLGLGTQDYELVEF